MTPSNACTLRITAAAGTELAGASSAGNVTTPGSSPEAASSPPKAVYDPQAFFPHAAWLGQAFAHCPRFPTAASRRSLGRVSVPVWLATLSGQLPVIALVGHYPTNELMGRGPIPRRQHSSRKEPEASFPPSGSCGISPGFPGLSPTEG